MHFGVQLRRLILATLLGFAFPAFGQAPTIASLSAPRQAVTTGQPLSLTVAAESATSVNYQWRHNGVPIAGATGANYTLAATTARHNGWYQVVVSNGVGSTVSRAIHVNVATSPGEVLDWGQYFNNEIFPVPRPPDDLTAIARISSTGSHNLALTQGGKVSAWGRPYEGQLDVPRDLAEVVDVAAGRWHSLALRADGRVVAWGKNDAGQTSVPANLERVVSIAGGLSHSLALCEDGSVIGWGSNAAGQCSIPASASNVVAIAAGEYHSLALRADGSVIGWGNNSVGQIAIPAGLGNVVAISSAFSHCLALKADGTVVAWGRNNFGQTTLPAGLGGVTAVSAGSEISLALKSDGTVVGWGSDIWRQLPVPTGLSSVVAIGAGSQHAIAVAPSTPDLKPLVVTHPLSQVVYTGRTLTLSVFARGPALSYQWRKDGVAIDRATQSTLSIPVQSRNEAGRYDVVVSNAQGSVTSNPAVITLAPGPTFSGQPSSIQVALGSRATLFAQAAGNGPLTYAWYHNGQRVWWASGNVLIIVSVTADNEGTYYLAATDSNGTTLSREVRLEIIRPPLITQQPADAVANTGNRVTFTVRSTSLSTSISYRWLHNGQDLSRLNAHVSQLGTESTLTISDARLEDAGTYAAVATNLAGSTRSEAATLTFPVTPVIKLLTKPEITQITPQAIQIEVVVYSATPVTNYQWRRDGVAIAGNTSARTASLRIERADLAAAGVYDVVVTNASGSTTGGRTVVTVIPEPVINAPAGGVVAILGQPLSLTVTAPQSTSYQWRKNQQDITANLSAFTATLTLPNITHEDASDYDVIVRGPSHAARARSVTVRVQAPTPSRLSNVSILTDLAPGGEVLTVGIVTGGASTTGDKPLLLRAVGPSLSQLGVQGFLPDPKLEFLRGAIVIGTNDDWRTSQLTALISAFIRVGAFSYSGPGALDAALYLPAVARGDYSARITSTTPAGGRVLAEVYDSTPVAEFTAATPRLINLSVIKRIEGSLTAGFVIAGTRTKVVLIRAIGPGLAAFNVPGFMPDPTIELFDSQRASLTTNDNWGGGAELATAFVQAGAFALSPASSDAALLRTLDPGAYTVQVSAANGVAGIGLIEIYEVP